jgi:three-Cys-motif partner protein
MNKFGGNWTEEKIQILETYARQFLKVFKNRPHDKLLYFDGFAGSGEISHLDSHEEKTIDGAAVRILKIDDPRSFDLYYFVEKEKSFAESLGTRIQSDFPKRNAHVVHGDCNDKLIALARFLKEKGKGYKVLGFIDPKGMQLEWRSLEALKGLPIDLWILNPTSGANRLLKRDMEIDESWLNRLNLFLGMDRDEIINSFYKPVVTHDLWGQHEHMHKESNCIQKLHELYAKRLVGNLFKYASRPRVLKNSQNSILFHFFMVTNNSIGLKIADAVVEPKNSDLTYGPI